MLKFNFHTIFTADKSDSTQQILTYTICGQQNWLELLQLNLILSQWGILLPKKYILLRAKSVEEG